MKKRNASQEPIRQQAAPEVNGHPAAPSNCPGCAESSAVLEEVGTVCHELNQPIQVISGYCELLSMDLRDDDPLSPKIHKILEQVERMGLITERIMKLTRDRQADDLEIGFKSGAPNISG